MPVPGTSLAPINANQSFNPSEAPEDIWYNERVMANAQGDILDQELRDRANQGLSNEDEARQRTEALYWELLTQPGLTPEEKAQYLDQARLEGLQFTPEQIESFGISADEQAGIRGDPYSALNTYYNPSHYDDIFNENNQWVRNAVENYRGGMDSAVGELRSGVAGSIDPERLRQDPAYRAQVMAELERGGADARSAVFDPGLDITDRYLSKRGYDDSDVQRMAEAAARDVGLRHRAAIVDLERSANRAGITDPYAIAAGRARYERQAAPLSADARMDAELAALEKQKNAEQDIQDTQLGAAGQRAGLRSSTALNLLGQRTNALQNMENSRIGAEQGLTGYRLQGAGMVGDMAFNSAREGGMANIANERDIRDTALAGERWKTDTALPAAERAEASTAGRNADLAYNRQGVARDVAGNQQAIGQYVDDTIANRTLTGINARRGDQQESRGYYGGQQDYAGGQYAQAMASRLANRGQTTSASQQAGQGQQSWQARPRFYQQLVNTAVGAAVGGATGALTGGANQAAGGLNRVQQMGQQGLPLSSTANQTNRNLMNSYRF